MVKDKANKSTEKWCTIVRDGGEIMHESSMLRMQWFADKYLQTKSKVKVLDVGSYDVNGCYREIFTSEGHEYKGLDMEQGPNVDICPKNAYAWNELPNDEYDVVVSGQALEHIEFFWVTMGEIVRVVKKGGLICLIAPNGFEEHRYPVDCWRFFTDGMIAIARYYKLEIIHTHTNSGPKSGGEKWFSEKYADSMLIAKKNYEGEAKVCDLRNYECTPAKQEDLRGDLITYKEKKSREEKLQDRGEIKKDKNMIEKIVRKLTWKKQ